MNWPNARPRPRFTRAKFFRREAFDVIEISVDMTKCQHYGQCVLEAPKVFRLNDRNRLKYTATAEDSELANVEDAVDVCPMQAISLVD